MFWQSSPPCCVWAVLLRVQKMGLGENWYFTLAERNRRLWYRGLVGEKIRRLGMQCCGVVGMDHHSLTLVKNIHGLMEIYLLRNVFLRGPTFFACLLQISTHGGRASIFVVWVFNNIAKGQKVHLNIFELVSAGCCDLVSALHHRHRGRRSLCAYILCWKRHMKRG